MDRYYDIFEILPDDSLRWRMCIAGAANVASALKGLGGLTQNECFAVNINTNEVLARVNEKKAKSADGS
jgi:hypothetical protein